MKKIRDNARKLLGTSCKVCPVCKGIACAGEVPGMGGIGTGASFQNNVNSLASITFRMKLIHDVAEPDPPLYWAKDSQYQLLQHQLEVFPST